MNKINLQNPGGFPFEQDTLKFMQDTYTDLLNNLGALSGDNTIISGCQVVGSQATDGLIYVNGELLPFRGGVIQANIIIVEEIVNMTYADGVSRPVYVTRYATFGTGAMQVLWTDLKRQYLPSSVIVGEIRMFAGNVGDLPAGWYVCDGTNGTPDLRGRFIVGVDPSDPDYDQIAKTGGSKEVALTEDEMPVHTHAGVTNHAGSHKHYGHVTQASGDWKGGGTDSSPNSTSRPGYTSTVGAHSHTLNINNAGGGDAHENRPPFFALVFIQFKGI